MEDAHAPVTFSDGLDDSTARVPAAQSATHLAADAWTANWGQLLRTARQIAGLSLTELSTATGLSKSYLSKLESGASGAGNPSRATLAALARALPSFRPLAHTLEPGQGVAALDYSGILAASSATQSTSAETMESPEVIEIGWRELEVIAALLALEAAAIPLRITAPMLARATGREVAIVVQTMDCLARQHIIEVELPLRVGDVTAYRCADDSLARLGVTRLGDLLVLAAALLAGKPAGNATVRTNRSPLAHTMIAALDQD